MDSLKKAIDETKKNFLDRITNIHTASALEQFRIEFLGRKGMLHILTTQFESLAPENKRIYGPLINQLKHFFKESFETKKRTLDAQQSTKKGTFDVTAHKVGQLYGSLHIYTHLMEQLEDIFIGMGYRFVDGPELESDYYNFNALNIPLDHPARDAMDTFWLTLSHRLMRTHTSSVQIHAMEQSSPPLAIFSMGRVYRNESTDASHDFMFTQVEGLCIDKNISMADLLGTAQLFLKHMFKKETTRIRVRPGYFPFVEPGVEIDCSCPFCSHGCSVCKQTTWIELMGAGLVHPNVLRCTGIDPAVYTGFAFGVGLERLGMILYGINDIRLFHSNSYPFLKQF